MSLASGRDSTQIWFCCSHASAHFSQQVKFISWRMYRLPESGLWKKWHGPRRSLGLDPFTGACRTWMLSILEFLKSSFKKLWLFQFEPYRLPQNRQQEDIAFLVQAHSPHYPHLNHILSQGLSTIRSLHFIMECTSFHDYSILTE